MIPSTLLLLAGLIFAGYDPETGLEARKAPAGLAARVWEVTDLVLDHHIDSPSRQGLILAGIRQLCAMAELEAPDGLARRGSAISSPEQLAPLLDEVWSRLPADTIPGQGQGLEAADLLIAAMVAVLPGGARVLTAQELKVEEQFAGNRYVGLQIALGVDEKSKRPSVNVVVPGGPAERAGLKVSDMIEEIDGTSTEGLPMVKVIDRLRGAEGTQVVIRVRQAKASESRVLAVTRGVLPKTTVKGIRAGAQKDKDVLIDDNDVIGCLKFEEILGSTPHELRLLARRLEAGGAKALVLDLRNVSQAHLHPTVLLADALLDGGTIGRMRTAGGVQTFRAEPDALFAGWPMAVLVANEMPPTVKWLAAALQDNHRAVIVGSRDPSGGVARGFRGGAAARPGVEADVLSAVPLGDGSLSIEMVTGRLQRGDGRSLRATERDAPNGLVPDITYRAPAPQPTALPRPDVFPLPGNLGPFVPAPGQGETNARAARDPAMAAAVERLRQLLLKTH